MNERIDLEARMRRLEDRHEIDELIARYCVAMDERDIACLKEIFTPDILIKSADGMMNSAGISAVIPMWEKRFKMLGVSNHFTHDRIIRFDDGDPDTASGFVNSHAEVHRAGNAMLASVRYDDVYQRLEGRWRFKQRTLRFFYYVAAAEYLEALGKGHARRMRAYGDQRAADWPEVLPIWKAYYGA